MATMVKLGVLILVVAVVAGTGNGAGVLIPGSEVCDYKFEIKTGTGGTDATVTVGAYGWNNAGWTVAVGGSGEAFNPGNTYTFFVYGKACMDPCRLTLAISAGSPWYPEYVSISGMPAGYYPSGSVPGGGLPVLKYFQSFGVRQWVYGGYPAIKILKC